ncbi:MAG TPA: glycosyltransferase [Blastocatellia bacterium]|nr:glycosyltransferase [Blastocatellia bacterium]
MKFSIVIPTYNRAGDLKESIVSIGRLLNRDQWELIVVDNNSSDDTREIVQSAQKWFPVPLHYIFEPEQGRCAALNAGIRLSTGEIIITTDDDVRVETDWLDRAAEALDRLGCDYVGGKVLPIWSAPRPGWLPNRGGRHWAVIALLDYGPEPIEFKRLMPLGVNMAFRREAFERAGLWDNRVGRKAGTLLGQEVREWGLRARAAGLKGFYAPEMTIRHIIPADRLTKRYFRRWFYWHGISRAMLYAQTRIDMEAPEETVLDFSKVPHIAGVPRYMYRSCLGAFKNMIGAGLRRDRIASFEYELWMWFFAGILRRRFQDRKLDGVQSNSISMPARFLGDSTSVPLKASLAEDIPVSTTGSIEPSRITRRLATK